jgi:hypothetical protein
METKQGKINKMDKPAACPSAFDKKYNNPQSNDKY